MINITEFQKFKNEAKPISIVTCYDYWSAKIIDKTEIDAVLVGDSVAMVVHGYDTTINADITMMETHVKAVRRGLKSKFLIADLPFLANQKGIKILIESVDKLMKAGAQGIKIEGAKGSIPESIKTITDAGIPVFGHLGLTPQSVNKFGGYKVQGKEKLESDIIFEHAQQLQNAGCSAIFLELIPSELAVRITESIKIPTIGIGAGPFTSGQVLVLQDLLGMNEDFHPKFVKKYLNGTKEIHDALQTYNDDVKKHTFPSKNESF